MKLRQTFENNLIQIESEFKAKLNVDVAEKIFESSIGALEKDIQKKLEDTQGIFVYQNNQCNLT